MSWLFPVFLSASIALGGSSELLIKVGDEAPYFSMRDLDRKVFSLSDYTGADAVGPKKVILMTFFATWCKPCKKEIPIIKRIHSRWSKRGVQVVYIGMSQRAKELSRFAKKAEFPWPVVPDAFGLLSRRYGATELPHLFLIDKEGKVAFQHRGIAKNLQQLIEAELAPLTGTEMPMVAEAQNKEQLPK